jgi:arylsulfatase A-like enzyme
LADEGVLFRNAWAHPVCSPFRSAVLTGRHAFRTGVGQVVTNNSTGLPEAEITIPEAIDQLTSLGADHAAFGKWHLGNESNGGNQAPNVAGFGHYVGGLGNINMGPPNQGPYDYFRWRKTTNGRSEIVERYAATETVDEALAWLSGRETSYFVYLAMHLPHSPFHAPPEALHSLDLPADAPGQGEDPKPYFSAMIEAMDSEVGRLLDGLSPAQRARTSVIYIGDNGSSTRTATGPVPRGRAKGTIYQGGLHVPLVLSGPAVVAPGREVDALTGSVDLHATVLDLMGAEPTVWQSRTDSVSLAPYLRDPEQPARRSYVLSEQFGGGGGDGDGKALRDVRFKYLRFDDGREELYDLEADPYEQRELMLQGLDAESEAALDRLRAELDRLLASSLPGTPEVPTVEAPTVEAPTIEAPTPTSVSPVSTASPSPAATLAGPTPTPSQPDPSRIVMPSLQRGG